ncbi:SprT-like family-domain-containing protein, partial [Hyaloraphidium curvatum]
RERLARDLYAEFNARIFSSLLPASLPIEWSNKLNTTAGRTHTRRERPLGGSEWTYHARIELSTKVLDAEGKLRSTLVHEMCHAAAWLVDRVDRPPHGKEFKRWGAKAERAYPDVEVATCHEYEIDYRFRWRCVNEACGKIYGRHSKSIDVAVHACGACRSRLEPL